MQGGGKDPSPAVKVGESEGDRKSDVSTGEPKAGNGSRRPATWEQVRGALAEARKAILRTDREDTGEKFSRVHAELTKGKENARGGGAKAGSEAGSEAGSGVGSRGESMTEDVSEPPSTTAVSDHQRIGRSQFGDSDPLLQSDNDSMGKDRDGGNGSYAGGVSPVDPIVSPKPLNLAGESLEGEVFQGGELGLPTAEDVFIPHSGEAFPVVHRAKRIQRSSQSPGGTKKRTASHKRGKRKRR